MSDSNKNQTDEDSDDSLEQFDSVEDELLYCSRNGKEKRLLQLLMSNEEAAEGNKLNLDCKGNQKFNRGWRPLHLAAYFGQVSAVRMLLEFGASVNARNTCMETALHLAAYTGREEVAGLLLKHGAETNVINSQNQKPRDVSKTQHIKDMIDAANDTACLRNTAEFLQAAADGDLEVLTSIFQQTKPPNINSQDKFGNSALHLAAIGEHGPILVFLMQHGIDTTIKNQAGQTALDVAQTSKIKQVLGVEPIKTLQKQPQRFEGFLMKKSRFVGFKQMWVVLDRGVLSFFLNRGDASTGTKRKGMKYLDEAKVVQNKDNLTEIRIEYSDGSKHTFHVESQNGDKVTLQKWLNALQEHIAYSTYYIHQGQGIKDDDTEDSIVSLGTMHDSLQNAQAHYGSLESQVHNMKDTIDSINAHIAATRNSNSNGAGGSCKDSLVVTQADLRIIESQASEILKSSQDMCTALSHCMTLLSQQEELRQIQLQEEQERCRVLQDSLHALATEHHELEKSLTRRPSFVSMEDEFFDCDDEEAYGSPNVDSFSDALSRDLKSDNSDGEPICPTSSYGRTTLPVPMFSRSDFSFWSILKQCIGKELSKITMPVVFNEPLSFIQRLAEYMEYAHLIELADKCEDPVQRLEYIAAFAVSAISSNWGRIGKPFNPLLGETYELDRPDLGFRFVGEQVSHHPPITAFYAEGQGFNFHGSIQPKLKFWGKTVEINPKGTVTLELTRHREVYSWQNVNCNIHNIIVGQLWVEHSGVMEITNNKNSLKASLNFKQCGWFGKELHHVEGFITNGKSKERALYGSWVLGMYSCSPSAYEEFMKVPENRARQLAKDKMADTSKQALLSYNFEIPGQKTLWKVHPRPMYSDEYYNFTTFAMCLNELLPNMNSTLPSTDSRFRPDIRSMEDGKIDYSAEEKNRVEEKQREARKERKKKSKDWTTLWFKPGPKEDYVFDKNYFKRDWSNVPDIF